MEQTNLLTKLYYNAETGFTSEVRLYQRAKEIDSKITHKIVKAFLTNQETAQIHKRRAVKDYFPLIAMIPFERIQIDLLDISNENPVQNGGNKFIFLAIDVFSRYAIAVLQKNKSEVDCLRSINLVNDKVRELGFTLKQIDSDSESAFKSHSFKKYATDNHLTQHFSQIGDHHSLGIVDRFCRTLRGYIAKYQVAYQTQRFIDVLPDLISNYNTAIHSTLKQSPVVAMLSGGISDYIPKQIVKASKQSFNKEEFPAGTRVRLRVKKQIFDKGEPLFTKSLHTISEFKDGLYYVPDRVGGYRKEELLKIGEVETAPQRIEPDDLEERKEEQVITRRVSRRIAKEGVSINNKEVTDEEKSIRAVRRKPVNSGFLTNYDDYEF